MESADEPMLYLVGVSLALHMLPNAIGCTAVKRTMFPMIYSGNMTQFSLCHSHRYIVQLMSRDLSSSMHIS